MKTPKLLLAVAALLMLHLPCALAQRQMEVRGRIVDSDGKALPGATVSVEGTKTGTATDADGTFLLKVP